MTLDAIRQCGMNAFSVGLDVLNEGRAGWPGRSHELVYHPLDLSRVFGAGLVGCGAAVPNGRRSAASSWTVQARMYNSGGLTLP